MDNPIYAASKTDGKTSIGIEIPTNVLRALRDGKAILNVTFGIGGATARVNELDPGVAHLSHTLTGYSDIMMSEYSEGKQDLPKMSGTWSQAPVGKLFGASKKQTDYPLPIQAKVDPPPGSPMGIQEASRRVADRRLNQHRIAGVLNQYPIDSLVDQDFKRTDFKDFHARVLVVSDKIGNAKAVSRIATNPSALRVESVSSLHEWWENSTVGQKVLLLTRSRSYKGKVSSRELEIIESIPCPFQDADLGAISDEETGETYSGRGPWSSSPQE